MRGEERAGQGRRGNGGEFVSGGGHGGALHPVRVSDKENLGVRVFDSELVGDRHRRVDVAARAARRKHDAEVASAANAPFALGFSILLGSCLTDSDLEVPEMESSI